MATEHELPKMHMPKHAHTIYNAADMTAGAVSTGTMANTFYGSPADATPTGLRVGVVRRWEDEDWSEGRRRDRTLPEDYAPVIMGAKKRRLKGSAGPSDREERTGEKEETADMANVKRIVRVIIVDSHNDVPSESAVLYMGDEFFTDKTDQELFFDLPVNELLKAHNEKRVTFKDKNLSRGKDKPEFLEPARIRDLDMVVLTISEFGA